MPGDTVTATHRPTGRRRALHDRRTGGRRASGVGRIAVDVRGVTATAANGAMLLDDVSFTAREGWFVAVVGPTGAGKTSLLDAIAGRLATARGAVRVSGTAAYVPQDDVLHGRLRLRRVLQHAAALRLPRGTGRSAQASRVDEVLADLDLGTQAALPVESLSGGERKRANVAVDLVGRPKVVLLDEPTTGLDPGHEAAVLGALRTIADGGRTVIAVTHGLAALSVCDRVLVLGRDGQVAFYGPPTAARAFFGPTEAAALFRDLDCPQASRRWAERFRAHPAHIRLVAGGEGPAQVDDAIATAPPPLAQLRTLVRRTTDLLLADRRRAVMLAVQGPVLGLLLLAVLRPGGLGPAASLGGTATIAMFLAVSATWIGGATTVREIVDELAIVQRDRGAGLSLVAYVVSKAAVLGAVVAVQAALLAAVAILRQDTPSAGAVLPWGALEVVATASMAGVAAVALGLLVSAVVTTSEKALAVLPLVLVTQLVFAGPWAAHAATPGLDVVRALTGARWGAAAIEATAAGDARAWAAAMLALGALTVGAVAGATALLGRRVVRLGRFAVRRRSWAASWSEVWRRPIVGAAGVGATVAVALVGIALVAPGGGTRAPVGPRAASAKTAEAIASPDDASAALAQGTMTTTAATATTTTTSAAPPVASAGDAAPTAPPMTAPTTPTATTPTTSAAPDTATTSTTATTATATTSASTTTTTAGGSRPSTTTTQLPLPGGQVSAASGAPAYSLLWWWQLAQAFDD